MKLTRLPCCGYQVDAADTLDGSGDKPGLGDVTLCLNCGAILIFTDSQGNVRPAQAGELFEESQDFRDRLQQMRRFIKSRGPLHPKA